MGEYASKGVAGTGLGLGIAGTALGVLAGSNNGNGLLGGLFGNNGNYEALWAENAKLKAEKYSDKNDVEVYAQTRRENQDLGDRLLGNWIKPIAQEAAANRERLATLEAKVDGNKALTDKDMIILRKDVEISSLRADAKVDQVASMAKCGLDRMSDAVRGLSETIDAWRCGKVSADAICPPVMKRWNAWEAPTNTAPDTQPVTGSINAR